MRDLASLPTPALLLDLSVLERNLSRMASHATSLGVSLRPHVKTHKCVEVALRQRALGARGITVSTLEEARVFAEAGFTDITWAFPLIPSRVAEALDLAKRVRLGLLVDSSEAVSILEGHGASVPVWLKVDCGYHRAGVAPDSALALSIARRLHESTTLSLAGLLTHAGHAYGCRSRDQILPIAEEERRTVADMASRLRSEGVEVPSVSVGSTPTMSATHDLTGVTEMRPGNYAFFDFSQVRIGSCAVGDCALSVLSTVVSSQPGAARSVIDAGALSLSQDAGSADGGMGRIFEHVEPAARLREDCRLVSLSQEHGKVDAAFPIGQKLRVLPNHSCLTAACFDSYWVVQDGAVVDQWRIHRGR